MDWFSRKVLSWQVSNTMDVQFALDALEEALSRYVKPIIFNSDQGAQFTAQAFTERLSSGPISKSAWMAVDAVMTTFSLNGYGGR